MRNTPPQDPTVALCLGTCGNPKGVGISFERGTLVVSGEEHTVAMLVLIRNTSVYLRLTDSCMIQLEAQRPPRTCNESKEEGAYPLFRGFLRRRF